MVVSKKQTPANALTAAIVNYLNLNGGCVTRVNSTGMHRNGRWTYSTTRKGTPDIMGAYNGKPVGIEVKIGKDKQSDYQKQFEEDYTKSGGVYIIAKTFDQFYEDFNNSLKKE